MITDHGFLTGIENFAGPLRSKTFRAAVEFILNHATPAHKTIIETGCYRGISGDGQSTMLLGLTAARIDGMLLSVEINRNHIAQARALTGKLSNHIVFIEGDSVIKLGEFMPPILFAYLDSFDHDDKNPGPCQRHQLAELGAVYGSLRPPCAVLLDDHIPDTGGKTKLSSAFLEDRGWKKVAEGYQLLYTRE